MSVKLRLTDFEKLAQDAGFADYPTLLHELYAVQGMSLTELGKRCHANHARIRRHLKRFGIPVRKRGGPNNVKVVITRALLDEVARDGIPAVSARLGVSPTVLYMKLRALSPLP